MAERKKIIVLDPAHGGTEDRGGSSWQGGASAGPNSIAEKDVSLALARAVKQRLDPTHDVRLTRDRDVNLSLSERATVSRDLGADIFLSIHFNAATDPAIDGTETWVANHASAASEAFAQSIPRRVAHAAGIEDRGMRRADFGVLLPSRHDPHTAACLVEVAFLTNPGEAARLRNAAYLGQLADALSDAVRAPAGMVSAQATAVPVIELTRVQFSTATAEFVRGPAGFDAILRGEFFAPESIITISGGLMMEENGKRREITPAELKKLAAQNVEIRAYPGGGVNTGVGYVKKIGADGCFTASVTVGPNPGTPRIRTQITVELKDGKKLTADGVFARRDLDTFLKYVDYYEQRLPAGQKDGKCALPARHLELLAAVRKMFQPPPHSVFTELFDLVLFRNRDICKLFEVDSPKGWDFRRFEECQIGRDIVDIGHVLVSIEIHRRQKPDAHIPTLISSNHAQPEALLGWAGDLGSALWSFARWAVGFDRPDDKPPVRRPCTVTPSRPPDRDLQWFLRQMAGRADLLGDIDGMNIGAVYDETKSLSQNLRAYYDARPFRRFHNFLASALDSMGKPLFTLVSPTSTRIDPACRVRAGSYIQMFTNARLYKLYQLYERPNHKPEGDKTDQETFAAMLQFGKPDMEKVIDYFFNFLEEGLSKE
jgi:N-acetylmuramoyl-L-alanine amidase